METSDSDDFADRLKFRLERFPSLGGSLSRPRCSFFKGRRQCTSRYKYVRTREYVATVATCEAAWGSSRLSVLSRFFALTRRFLFYLYTYTPPLSLISRPFVRFSLFFFLFFFFLREFVASFSRGNGERWRRERARGNIAGRHFSRRNAESLRSREALRSKRSRCSYRFRANSFSRAQLVVSSFGLEREREREGFKIEHHEQRELSRADSWLRADEIRFERRELVEPGACAFLFVSFDQSSDSWSLGFVRSDEEEITGIFFDETKFEDCYARILV